MSTHGGAESGGEEQPFMEAYGNPRLTYGDGVWVRRQADEPTGHCCPFPEGGSRGDLWRRGCGALWRLGDACDWCDRYGVGPHRGQCMVGATWRRAPLRRRTRYWRR